MAEDSECTFRANIRLQTGQVPFSAKNRRVRIACGTREASARIVCVASPFSKLVPEPIPCTVDIYCPARYLRHHFNARPFVISLDCGGV